MFNASPVWAEKRFSTWLENSFLSANFSEIADLIPAPDCNIDVVITCSNKKKNYRKRDSWIKPIHWNTSVLEFKKCIFSIAYDDFIWRNLVGNRKQYILECQFLQEVKRSFKLL